MNNNKKRNASLK